MVNDPERSTLYEGWGIEPDGFSVELPTMLGVEEDWLLCLNTYVASLPQNPVMKNMWYVRNRQGLNRLECLVPTVKGNIQVSFVDNDREFALNVLSPDGMKATICLPATSKTISLNGKVIWSKGKLTAQSANLILSADKVNTTSIAFQMNGGGDWKFTTTK